ncbi:MAG: hypothetical protein AAGA66_13130 [Bacteroidota bacterium]
MILWGNEHKERAEALAQVYRENSHAVANLSRSSSGIEPINSVDSTLTVWGHGNAEVFSEMLDVEFGKLIKAWKKLNPQLKVVELVTCDAQHHLKPLAGYAKRVARFIKEDHNCNDVKIKALPVGQHQDDRSILWASAGTKTFCYITAPSRETFDHANQRLLNLERNHGSNLGLVASEMAKERTLVTPTNFTTNGGDLKVLRASLVAVEVK